MRIFVDTGQAVDDAEHADAGIGILGTTDLDGRVFRKFVIAGHAMPNQGTNSYRINPRRILDQRDCILGCALLRFHGFRLIAGILGPRLRCAESTGRKWSRSARDASTIFGVAVLLLWLWHWFRRTAPIQPETARYPRTDHRAALFVICIMALIAAVLSGLLIPEFRAPHHITGRKFLFERAVIMTLPAQNVSLSELF